MSRILLVRHGQASWGKKDYDHLSKLGERQAAILGTSLAARGIKPTIVTAGSLERQQQTVARLCHAAGWEQEVETDQRWNEYDHQAIITAHKPAYRSMTVMKADLVRTFRPYRAFMAMFEKAMIRWAEGEHDGDYPETFSAFTTRVEVGLADILGRLGADETAVVTTSAGPVCWALTSTLGGDPLMWGKLQYPIVNSSVSTITTSPLTGPLVAGYNDHSHLDVVDPALVTSR
ncbi:MAG: histidine phosphatase family protein [Nostocoides sp.]